MSAATNYNGDRFHALPYARQTLVSILPGRDDDQDALTWSVETWL
jgi:hypothetical protein